MNAHESDFELIRRCRDGEASAEEFAAMENRLRTDAAFRQRYVRYMNLDVALETAAVAVESAPQPTPARIRVSLSGARWLWGWPRPALAGLLVGLLIASMAWAVALPRLTEARVAIQPIFSENFEAGAAATSPGLPRECGVWSGDEATVVPAEQGVKPKSGVNMLRFVSATHPGENALRSLWGDVYRLADVRRVARDGHDLARLSASFAESPVAAGEQYACSVEAIALEQDLSSLPVPLRQPWAKQNSSATSSRTVPMVGNCQWQDVSVEIPISPKTQFVLLHLAVVRQAPTIETGAVRFSGHYLDDVRLELVSRHPTH